MKRINFPSCLLFAVFGLTLSACSSAPKEVPMLEEARASYTDASQDITVAKHAPQELDKARQALHAADQHWQAKDERSRVEHYAYLVKQRVKIAQLIAENNETDRDLKSMVLERRNVTLDLREAELDQARQRAQELERQMQLLQAEKTDRGMVLTLGDVLFDIDEASLAPGAARNIAKIASFMRSYPERRAVIEGHTDSMGDEHYNLTLSRERAMAVRDALVDAGIPNHRISTRGFGEVLPVATNSTSSGRQKNRRVEIIFPDESPQVSELYD
ncbi:MAG: OmpA family protein [Granulosicoccus sp.]|nr:OmpA family protein [Granulosicoccus sp.]